MAISFRNSIHFQCFSHDISLECVSTPSSKLPQIHFLWQWHHKETVSTLESNSNKDSTNNEEEYPYKEDYNPEAFEDEEVPRRCIARVPPIPSNFLQEVQEREALQQFGLGFPESFGGDTENPSHTTPQRSTKRRKTSSSSRKSHSKTQSSLASSSKTKKRKVTPAPDEEEENICPPSDRNLTLRLQQQKFKQRLESRQLETFSPRGPSGRVQSPTKMPPNLCDTLANKRKIDDLEAKVSTLTKEKNKSLADNL